MTVPPRLRLPLAALLSLAVASFTVWLMHGHMFGRVSPGAGRIWFPDAFGFYRPTFVAIWSGAPTPEGWLYPPFFAVVGAPFGLLSTYGFLAAWGVVQAAAFILAALVIGGELQRIAGERWALLFVALLGLSDGVVHTILWGQVSVLLLGVVAAAYALEARGRTVAGAAILAAAVAIKFYPIGFLLYWIFRRQWRFVGLTAAFVVGWSLMPWLVLGPERAGAMLSAALGGVADLGDLAPELFMSQSWIAVLGRLAGFTGVYWPWAMEFWIPALLVFGAASVVVVRDLSLSGRWLAASGLMWCAIPFAPGAIWTHYLAYLPLAQVMALLLTLGSPWRSVVRILVVASAVLASALASLVMHPAVYPAIGIPFFASLLAGVALLVAHLSTRELT